MTTLNGLNRLNTLGARITLGQGVLIGGIVVIALSAVAALHRVRTTVSLELNASSLIADASGQAVAALFDQMRTAEQYFSDNTEQVRTEYWAASAMAHERQEHLLALPNLSQAERLRVIRIGALQAEAETWYAYAHTLHDLRRRPAAAAAAATARGRAAELMTLLRAFSTDNVTASAEAAAVLVSSTRQREATMWLALVASIAVGGAVIVLTLRSVDTPLIRLTNLANRFAQGDVRPVSLGGMPRELERVGTAITDIGARLRALVKEVTHQSDRIVATAGDLSAMSEELAASGGMISQAMIEISEGARSQVSSLETGGHATEKLRTAARRNAEVAVGVSRTGERIHELATRHGEDVTAAGVALLELGRVVQASAEQVEELDAVSDTIDEFVDLIKQVSSQTNLLALNAAIEAARASTGGQGFAVVADEVRQLADSSGEAAENAAKSITVVRRQVAEVSETMVGGRQRVRGVESVAQSAAKALDEIVKVVAEVEEAARLVSESTQSNVDAADEIARLMKEVAREAHAHAGASEQVSAAAQQQGASTEEIAAQAADLNLAAERLRAVVEGLRT